MSSLNGRDIVDFAAEGVLAQIKDHLRKNIVKDLVKQFEGEVQKVVDDKLSEMIFNMHKNFSAKEQQDQLQLLIVWSKGDKEYKTEYKLKGKIIS